MLVTLPWLQVVFFEEVQSVFEFQLHNVNKAGSQGLTLRFIKHGTLHLVKIIESTISNICIELFLNQLSSVPDHTQEILISNEGIIGISPLFDLQSSLC